MSALLVGALGFLLLYPTDWLQLKRAAWARAALLALGGAVQAYGLLLALTGPERLSLPAAAVGVGWALLPVAVFLLIYSLFVEVPFGRAFLPWVKGLPRHERLVTTGTYALTRHPGVLWYALFVLALFLVSGSADLLLAGPVWVAMDALWVLLQDRIFFPRILPGYREYSRITPMLIPTGRSVAACFETIQKRRAHGDTG